MGSSESSAPLRTEKSDKWKLAVQISRAADDAETEIDPSVHYLPARPTADDTVDCC